MPRVLFSVALTLTTAATAAAQQAPPQVPGIDFAAIDAAPAQQSPAFAAFRAVHGGAWWTRWCRATDTPSELFGTGIDLADWRGSTLLEARRQARQALQDHGELLGLGADEFRESFGGEFGNVWSFTFAQHHRGIEVVGGRADIRIAKRGRIAFLGSTALRVPADITTIPALDQAEAERIAWLQVDVRNRQPLRGERRKTRLVYWGDLEATSLAPVHLCWEVPIDGVDAAGNGPVGRWYVDAKNGTLHRFVNDKHDCGFGPCRHPMHAAPAPSEARAVQPTTVTVMAYARNGISGILTPTNVPMPGLQVNVPGVGVRVTDQAGQFTVDLTVPTPITVDVDGIHHQLVIGAGAPSVSATLQPGVNATIQLLPSTATDAEIAHTTCSLWTHSANEFARSILGNTPPMTQADAVLPTVNIASSCNAYYVGNTINFYSPGGNCTNMAAGSVIAHEWGHGLDDQHGGISQTQGLSEGWADIVSMYLFDDPTIGPGFFTNGAGIRTGLNARQYPPPTEVHAAGEVWMGFAWKFRENLKASLGIATGTALGNQLVLGSIVAGANDQPSAVTQVFVADDSDGDLTNGVNHYAQLEAACLVHNLPYPHLLVGFATAPTIGDTDRQLVARQIIANIRLNSGSYTAIELVYDDGVTHRQQMIPTGSVNEYQALIAGQLAPKTVTWHIEATHSTGTIVRAPESGDNSFKVYANARVFFEDFEGNTSGWTHGAISGVDEWQIGSPLGRSGLDWTDPTSAASGSVCAGIDLTADGAYAPSSTTWLRSPTIDCRGRTGVKVRFKRWASFAGVNHSFATVRCNGATFWLNGTLAPTVDGGWVTQEVRLLNADNNQNVVLEWQLQADATTTYGGWAIDDVELLATNLPVPVPDRLSLSPPMPRQGTPVTIAMHTALPNNPFVIVAGDAPGPLAVPGLPLLELGGNLVSLGGTTDASGNFAFTFTAPSVTSLTGLTWYTQALTLDGSQRIVVTNPGVNLFTQ